MTSKEIPTKQQTSREWMWLLAVVAVAVVMYIPTLRYFWRSWMGDSQYSLAYLVPFVSGYFIWIKWATVKKLKRSSCRAGLSVIVLGLLVHLAGTALDISGLSSVSLLLCLVGGCMYFHSKALVQTLAFPLAYMVFMIPIPGGVVDRVGFPLQLWASGGTAMLLKLMQIEVVHNGVNLTVDGNSFTVAQACSGMSSLVALVGVTAVFAYITKLPVKFKWALFFLSIPVALIANVVRITTIGLVAYQWGADSAIKIYHDWSSPILFMAAILMLFFINWGFEWLSARRTTS